jgi:hypothetical protein
MSDQNPAIGPGDGLPEEIARVIRGDPDPDRTPSLHEEFIRREEELRRRTELTGEQDPAFDGDRED